MEQLYMVTKSKKLTEVAEKFRMYTKFIIYVIPLMRIFGFSYHI
jgi:hypothetical protein